MNKWLTPQEIIEADARQMVDYVWRWFQPGLHGCVALSELRRVMLHKWATQPETPNFMKTGVQVRAWQDGGVFAEAFDRIWRERVEQEANNGA